MDESSLERLAPHQLARLLDVEESGGWSTSERAAIIEHQLAAPLLPDLSLVPGMEVRRLQLLIANRQGAESFLRQLTFIHPSLELLEAIKQFGRHHREDFASPLHESGGTLFYYAAIAAALVRCKARITQLTDAELQEGFGWALNQPACGLQMLFSAALEQLAPAP